MFCLEDLARQLIYTQMMLPLKVSMLSEKISTVYLEVSDKYILPAQRYGCGATVSLCVPWCTAALLACLHTSTSRPAALVHGLSSHWRPVAGLTSDGSPPVAPPESYRRLIVAICRRLDRRSGRDGVELRGGNGCRARSRALVGDQIRKIGVLKLLHKLRAGCQM